MNIEKNHSEKNETFSFYPWLVLIAASLLFFYTFVQIDMLSPLGAILMYTFHWNAATLGTMSAMYFYGCFLIIFPAGLLLDRYSPRKIMFISLFITSISMFTFALSTNFWDASISRFIQGICGSFGFLGAIRIVSRWFPPKKLALASGSIVTLAMLGGIVGQIPVASLSILLGWRHTVVIVGLVGLVLAFVELMLVRDYPAHYVLPKQPGAKDISSIGFWKSIRMVVGNRYNWLGGLYTTLMNLPVWTIGALWGGVYLTQAHSLSAIRASEVSAELFLGTLIGSPLIGWISDKLGRRVLPMILGAFFSAILILLIIYLLNASFVALIIMFFLLGLVSSTQVLTYPTIAELNSPLLTGSAIGVISLLVMASGFIVQPCFGWLLELHWQYTFVNQAAVYSMTNFRLAMWIMPIGFVLSFFFAFFIKETYCKRQFKED